MTGLLLVLTALSAETAEDIVARAGAVEKRVVEARAPYVFKELQENEDFGTGSLAADRPRTRLYEHIFLEGAPYRLLVERNGKPLSDEERKRVEDARKKEQRQRRESRGRKFLPGTRYQSLGLLAVFPKYYAMRLAGEEEIGGRRTHRVIAEPLREAKGELPKYRQTLWIDHETSAVARRRVEVLEDGADLLPGSVSTFYYENRDGVWFEMKREIDFVTKVFGVRKVRGRQTHTFYDFKRFSVESTITVADPD